MGQIVHQKTLKNAISCTGIGLHSGVKVTMTLLPADENSGIVFKRTDIHGNQAAIPADWRNVTDSQLCTAISKDSATIYTIEHLMAALAAAGVDNATIELNGPEVPIMDGSAAPFVFLIECAGTVEQAAARRAVVVKKPVAVTVGDKRAAIEPGAGFSISFDIDFASAAVRQQTFAIDLVDGAFKSDIARARTFGFAHEVNALQAQGLLKGGSLENAVVVSGDKILNASGLRYADEFVRHKVLDSVGDLYLAGMPLIGRFHGSRSGHRMNHQLLQALFADRTAHEIVDLDSDLMNEDVQDNMPLIAAAAPAKFVATPIR